MQTHLGNGGDEPTIDCPVPSCSRSYQSAQAVAAHVGSGHENGWEEATRSPRDIHEEATANDAAASRRGAKVTAYLAREGVTSDAVNVYVHQGYDSVQIHLESPLNDEQWSAFREAVVECDGFRYVGGDTSYATTEFVESLPDVRKAGACMYPDCDRGEGLAPVYNGSQDAVTLCRAHRKEWLGVSS